MTLPLHVETRTDRRDGGTRVALAVAAIMVALLAFTGAHGAWLVATAAPAIGLVVARGVGASRRRGIAPELRMRISSDGVDVPVETGLAHLGWDELDAVRVRTVARRTEIRLQPSSAGRDEVAVDLTGASVSVVEIAASVRAASRGRLRLSLA